MDKLSSGYFAIGPSKQSLVCGPATPEIVLEKETLRTHLRLAKPDLCLTDSKVVNIHRSV